MEIENDTEKIMLNKIIILIVCIVAIYLVQNLNLLDIFSKNSDVVIMLVNQIGRDLYGVSVLLWGFDSIIIGMLCIVNMTYIKVKSKEYRYFFKLTLVSSLFIGLSYFYCHQLELIFSIMRELINILPNILPIIVSCAVLGVIMFISIISTFKIIINRRN
ncbi:hypothetical protein [Clostridium saccharoperbutylacetonicum]|uniref:hypothetical protein n=1 Tax=Clostridium saccharoperbutylacetonicum TaxID=36745 RepID=UPI0039EBD006